MSLTFLASVRFSPDLSTFRVLSAAVRKNRYVILPLDFEEAYKSSVKKSDDVLEFCQLPVVLAGLVPVCVKADCPVRYPFHSQTDKPVCMTLTMQHDPLDVSSFL